MSLLSFCPSPAALAEKTLMLQTAEKPPWNIPKESACRLEAYDYSQPGYYFITVCTHARQRLFDDFVGADLMCPPVP